MALPRKFFNDDEDLLVEMRPHWVFFAGPLSAAVAVVAGVIAILVALSPPNWAIDILLLVAAVPVLWFLGRLLRWRTYAIVLTTTRIVVRRGVLGRNTTQIRLQRITEICISQKLWERVIQTGRLLVDLQGEDDAVVLEFIRKPAIVQRVINGQINELTGGGRAEPVPQELLGSRRRPAPPEPEHAGDTPPFGVPIVNAQGEVWSPSMPSPAATAPTPRVPPVAPVTAPTPPATAGPPPPVPGSPPQPTVVPAGPAGPAGSAAPGEIRNRLIELDDLRQRKIISEEEFAAKKAELLSRI